MDAVIFVDGAPESAHWDVAGTPLLIRQLEWLVSSGCEKIVVERCAADERWNEMQQTLSDHAVAATIETVLSPKPLGGLALAERAGLGERPFLAISSRVLGSLDLRTLAELPAGSKAMFAPPAKHEALFDADVYVLSSSQPAITNAQTVDGWGVLLASEQDAHELGAMALMGELDGVLVHAAEVSPGVWTARGSVIEEGAVVRAPVFVGANALVCERAVIGPNAVIGARAVVSPTASVRDALVRADTMVGEGLAIERCAADGDAIDDWTTGSVASLGDELLLGRREGAQRALAPRLLAAMAAFVLAPIAALTASGRALLRELWQVVEGTRCWLGATTSEPAMVSASAGLVRAAQKAPRGVISVERALATEGEDQLRMLAWYAHEKNARLDASLLWQRAMHAIGVL